MPSYEVLEVGFFNGHMYDPKREDRRVLHTEKQFPLVKKVEQVPSWLKRIKEETAAEQKKRLALEAQSLLATQDSKKEIKETMNFVDTKPTTVKTL